MGLSGARKRTRLANDPNNTTWSRATDRFGHRILSAQGWRPGQLLGAKDARQAEHFSAANASHIRVAFREDNLGLGAQVGKSNADTFGLSTLAGIFGRLNGTNEDDLRKRESAYRDVELQSYQTRKYGAMNFVRGGVLLGDKVENLQKEEDCIHNAQENPGRHEADLVESTAVTKPRKKQEKKRKHAEPRLSDDKEPAEGAVVMRKVEKRERREARRRRKAASQDAVIEQVRLVEESTSLMPSSDEMRSGATTPSATSSRHNVRQRFIQQKRMASMDARALNEILMRKMPVC